MSARRTLPQWRKDVFDDSKEGAAQGLAAVDASKEVVLLADTFNRYFERENLDAAVTVLRAAGYTVHIAKPVERSSGRSAAAARSWRSAWSIRRGARPSA